MQHISSASLFTFSHQPNIIFNIINCSSAMSTRWYPLYTKGNPQLRVFLPNFWMKLVKSEKNLPENVVTFQTSQEMTHYDVKNYLEKIYNIEVVDAKVEIVQGKLRRAKGRYYVVKDDDYKLATVTLPRDMKFEFPNLFSKDQKKDQKTIEEAQKSFASYTRRNLNRPGLPGWYSF